MTGVAWAFNETGTSGAPAVTSRQLRQMHSVFVAMGSTARPLGAKSGVRVGTPSTVVSISGSGTYTWSAGGFGGIIDGEANAAAGPYQYAFENAETGSIVASGAAARVDRLDVQISDSDEGDSSGTKTVKAVYTQGAATGGQPPNPPARSHRLGYINVPTAGAPTFTFAPEWAGDPGEWTFNTLAELTAYTTLITAANVPAGQRATVIADTTVVNNGDFVWSGTAWQRAVPKLSHVEYTTNVVGLTDGNGFSAHNYAIDSANSTDSTLVSVATPDVTLRDAGEYSVSWTVAMSAASTSAGSVIAISLNGTQIAVITLGTTSGGVITIPNLYVPTAGAKLRFTINKFSGGGLDVNGRVRITKIGG